MFLSLEQLFFLNIKKEKIPPMEGLQRSVIYSMSNQSEHKCCAYENVSRIWF